MFDRNWLSHKVNLFDMNAKYGDVMFLDEVLAYFDSLRAGELAGSAAGEKDHFL